MTSTYALVEDKHERIKRLYYQYWNPRAMVTSYFAVYWREGAVRSIMIFFPLYLYSMGISAFEVAFISVMVYITWNFKFLIGILLDISPAIGTWRRRPWILFGTLLSIFGAIWLANTSDLWWGIFPSVFLIMTGDAFVDIGADALLLDVTPPDWHGFGLGAGWGGRAVGYVVSVIITGYVVLAHGWYASFYLYALYATISLVALIIKEPPLTSERKISVNAIVNTFADPYIFLAVAFAFMGCFLYSFDPNRGILSQIIYAKLGVALSGLPPFERVRVILGKIIPIMAAFGIGVALASPSLGRLADKIGHKRGYYLSLIGGVIVFLVWAYAPMELIGYAIPIYPDPILSGTVVLSLLLGIFEGWNFAMWETILADVVPPEFPAFMFQYFMCGVHGSALILGILVGLLLDAGFSIQFILTVAAVLVLIGVLPLFKLRPLTTSKAVNI